MAYYYGKASCRTYFGVTSKVQKEKRLKDQQKDTAFNQPLPSNSDIKPSCSLITIPDDPVCSSSQIEENNLTQLNNADDIAAVGITKYSFLQKQHIDNELQTCNAMDIANEVADKQETSDVNKDEVIADKAESNTIAVTDMVVVNDTDNEEDCDEEEDQDGSSGMAGKEPHVSRFDESGRPEASAFRPSRHISNCKLKECGLGKKYPDKHKEIKDFYRYLRSSGKPHGFARNIATAINKYLFWACDGNELSWQPIVDSRKLRVYTDLLYKDAKLCESSVCNFIGSVDRARQFACYRRHLSGIDYKEDIFLSGLFNRFRALRKTREKEVRASYQSGSFLIDPAELFKVVNHSEYRDRFEELTVYAKTLIDKKSWQTFDRKSYTYCLRFVLAQLLVTCRPKLSALCNMTFADVQESEGSWDNDGPEIVITISDRKITSMDGMMITVLGYAKYALQKFIHYIRLVVPLVQKDTKNLVFVNSNGGKLGPAQVNRHMDQFFGIAGYNNINTTRIAKSVEHGAKEE